VSARIYSADVFSAPPSELAGLLDENHSDSFFTLPEWFAAVSTCGLAAQGRAGLLTNSDCSSGLPFLLDGSSSLQSCTNLYTCEFDLLGSKDPAGVQHFAQEVACLPELAPYIKLEGLNPRCSTISALANGFRAAGLIVKPYRGWATWYEPVQSITFERYLEQRPPVLQTTWRRKLKSLEKVTGFEIDVSGNDNNIESFIGAYEAVESESWKGKEPFPEFIRNLIRLAAQKGALRSGVLSIENTPAAAQFWIVWKGTAVIFKLAYAKRFSGYSPGTVLTMHMVRLILEEGRAVEISFGRGDDPYKRLWASFRRDYWGIEAANPRKLRGWLPSLRLESSLLRDFLKGVTTRKSRAD
jgi:hypothetical protein